MNLIVFVGPSLRDRSAYEDRGIVFHGPARCGDVMRAAAMRPRAIGLVDGYFETSPAPWHKELLWALCEGIALYGAASMGALRAAEMAPFGMIGVGRIYELYRDGKLEDDDAVAVLHGPREMDYLPLTEPLVNISATLEAMSAGGIVVPTEADSIRAAARSLFYKDRTWAAVLTAARAAGLSATALDSISESLPSRSVDQKASDARAMIESMLASAESERASPSRLPFVRTKFTDALFARGQTGSGGAAIGG